MTDKGDKDRSETRIRVSDPRHDVARIPGMGGAETKAKTDQEKRR